MTEFVGMAALVAHKPLTTVSSADRHYDLHNFGRLEGMEVSASNASVSMRWRVTEGIEGPPTLIVFEMTGVSSCKMSGEVFRNRQGRNTNGLDFVEYSVDKGHLGAIRFVFDNEAEIEVEAARCTLRSVAA